MRRATSQNAIPNKYIGPFIENLADYCTMLSNNPLIVTVQDHTKCISLQCNSIRAVNCIYRYMRCLPYNRGAHMIVKVILVDRGLEQCSQFAEPQV